MTIVAGVDVDSGRQRKSTGLCRTRDVRFLVARVTSDGCEVPQERVLPRRCDVLAVGGPVLRPGFPLDTMRGVERLFSVGTFQKRCKPASAVAGKGSRTLRQASQDCIDQLVANVRTSRELLRFPHVVPDTSIVEASPLVFLGVMVDDVDYERRPSMGHAAKLRWLFEQCRDSGKLTRLRERLDWSDDRLWDELEGGSRGEQLSALVCGLTAIAVVRKCYVAVGDLHSGFYFLPPWELWAEWAKAGLRDNRSRPEVGDALEVWINAYPRDKRSKLPA